MCSKKNLDATTTPGLATSSVQFINLILYMKSSIKKRNQPCCCGVFPGLGSTRKQKNKERGYRYSSDTEKSLERQPHGHYLESHTH